MRPGRDGVQDEVRKVFLSIRRGKELIQVLDRGIAEKHLQGWPKAADSAEPRQLAGSRGDDLFLAVTKGAASILGLLNEVVELDGRARMSLSTALRTMVVRKCLARDPELQTCIKHVATAADAVRHLTPAVIEQTVAALVNLVGDTGPSPLGGAVGNTACEQWGPRARHEAPRDGEQSSMGMVAPQSDAAIAEDSGDGECKQSELGSVMSDGHGTPLACMMNPNHDHAAAPSSCQDWPKGQQTSEPKDPRCLDKVEAVPNKPAARWADGSLSADSASNYQGSLGAESFEDGEKHDRDSELQADATCRAEPASGGEDTGSCSYRIPSDTEQWSSHDLAAVLSDVMLGLSHFNVQRESISLHLKNGELEICVSVRTRKAVTQLLGWCKNAGFVPGFVAKFCHLGVCSACFCILRDK